MVSLSTFIYIYSYIYSYIYMCVCARTIFIKEASREDAVDILQYTCNYRHHPHTGSLSWTRTRTRYRVYDTTVSIPVFHSTHHYRRRVKSRVLKPKGAQHVSLYYCSRLCHRWSQLPRCRSSNGPASNLASTSPSNIFHN